MGIEDGAHVSVRAPEVDPVEDESRQHRWFRTCSCERRAANPSGCRALCRDLGDGPGRQVFDFEGEQVDAGSRCEEVDRFGAGVELDEPQALVRSDEFGAADTVEVDVFDELPGELVHIGERLGFAPHHDAAVAMRLASFPPGTDRRRGTIATAPAHSEHDRILASRHLTLYDDPRSCSEQVCQSFPQGGLGRVHLGLSTVTGWVERAVGPDDHGQSQAQRSIQSNVVLDEHELRDRRARWRQQPGTRRTSSGERRVCERGHDQPRTVRKSMSRRTDGCREPIAERDDDNGTGGCEVADDVTQCRTDCRRVLRRAVRLTCHSTDWQRVHDRMPQR